MIKNIILLATTIFVAIFISMSVLPNAYAATFDPLSDACSQGSSSGACQGSGGSNPISGPDGIVNKVATLLMVATGVVAVVMIMIAGFTFITSNGDAGRVATARNTVIYALVGVVIAATAKGIIAYVIPKVVK